MMLRPWRSLDNADALTTAPTATTFFIEAAGKPTSNVAPKRGGSILDADKGSIFEAG
jgi:hypothetical protein